MGRCITFSPFSGLRGDILTIYDMMTEEFIHFLWKFRMLKPGLTTTDGEDLQIIHQGDHNTDSGPDFFNARIRIGGTLWAGNVEMHVLASDWNRHKHGADRAYDNTILHVVYDEDTGILRQTGGTMPTLVIRDRFPAGLYTRYEDLMENRQWIPCSKLLDRASCHDFGFWAPSLVMERILGKAEKLRELLKHAHGDWEETFYRWLIRGFGFRINAFPCEMLARSLPYRLLNRYRSSDLQVEALLFGQANLMGSAAPCDYLRRLRIEYGFLRAKHQLEPVSEGIWKFLRLRPSNFPTIRLSQFGNLLLKRDAMLPFILSQPGIKEISEWLEVAAGSFWDDHFTFDRISPACRKNLGTESVRLLIINVVVPFLFYYGLEKEEVCYKEHAIRLLESLPGEKNKEVSNWEEAGMAVHHALNTQALLQLKSNYCDRKRCLECRIGKVILDLK